MKLNNERKKTRTFDNGMYVMDVGYRNEQPVALVERTFSNGSKEYIIAFSYKVRDNKLEWGYGYYYDTNLEKAKEDFKKVLAGGNLADTFSKKNKAKER